MSPRLLDVRGRNVALIESGSGAPLVYLHGFADVHAAPADLQSFHLRLADKGPRPGTAHILAVPAAESCPTATQSTTLCYTISKRSTRSASIASISSVIVSAAGLPQNSRCAIPSA